MWGNDAEVMSQIDNFLTETKEPLGNLMNSLHKHNDGSLPFQMLHIYATFVFQYSNYRENNTESDAWDLALASTANTPVVSQFVANMMQAQIDRRFNIE